MGNTINDLYLKYVNNVGETLEDDRYFQYLFEMVQAGVNTLQQTHQVLHKVVDERWLTTIEESLDAINEIIEKPFSTVKSSEEFSSKLSKDQSSASSSFADVQRGLVSCSNLSRFLKTSAFHPKNSLDTLICSVFFGI